MMSYHESKSSGDTHEVPLNILFQQYIYKERKSSSQSNFHRQELFITKLQVRKINKTLKGYDTCPLWNLTNFTIDTITLSTCYSRKACSTLQHFVDFSFLPQNDCPRPHVKYFFLHRVPDSQIFSLSKHPFTSFYLLLRDSSCQIHFFSEFSLKYL